MPVRAHREDREQREREDRQSRTTREAGEAGDDDSRQADDDSGEAPEHPGDARGDERAEVRADIRDGSASTARRAPAPRSAREGGGTDGDGEDGGGADGEDAEVGDGRESVSGFEAPTRSERLARRSECASQGGLTLLVIEDDPAGVLGVPGILNAAGDHLPEDPGSGGERIRVRTARNLSEADRLLADDVQCILLDLALTGPQDGAYEETRGPDDFGGGQDGDAAAEDKGGREKYEYRYGYGSARATRTSRASHAAGDVPRPRQRHGPEPRTSRESQAPRPPQARQAMSGGGPAASSGTDAAAASGDVTPDADPEPHGRPGELDALRRVLSMAPRHAVLALTDGTDAERAAAAVSVGAQDYLFRDELDGRLLSRAVRYAVERKRSDLAQQQLTESRLRAQENARLERGLLPTPLLEGSDLRFAARYRPGRSRALLGGDFYDTVRTVDGAVHAMIGDVSGHGPDEAALGVELRIAWRALTFAGLCGDELLGTLQKVLEHERASDEVFATLCTVDISADGRRAGVCLAGHPSPLVAGGKGAAPRLLPYDDSGPALGVLRTARWPRRQVELGRAWSLLMYTDGLIDGHVGEGRKRLGQDGMVDIVAQLMAHGERGEALLDATMEDVRSLNGGELTDDVAVLLLDRG